MFTRVPKLKKSLHGHLGSWPTIRISDALRDGSVSRARRLSTQTSLKLAPWNSKSASATRTAPVWEQVSFLKLSLLTFPFPPTFCIWQVARGEIRNRKQKFAWSLVTIVPSMFEFPLSKYNIYKIYKNKEMNVQQNADRWHSRGFFLQFKFVKKLSLFWIRFRQYGRWMVWMVRMDWLLSPVRRRTTTAHKDLRRTRLPEIVRLWRSHFDGARLQPPAVQRRLELLDRVVGVFRHLRTRNTIAFAYLFRRRWRRLVRCKRPGHWRMCRPFGDERILQQSQLWT